MHYTKFFIRIGSDFYCRKKIKISVKLLLTIRFFHDMIYMYIHMYMHKKENTHENPFPLFSDPTEIQRLPGSSPFILF